MPASQTVEVNFALTPVDVSGTVNIFGQEKPSVSNIITADVTLVYTALNGLLEFWEPSEARGTFKAERTQGWKQKSVMTTNLQSIITGGLDAKDAAPFSEAQYSAVSDYTHFNNFGELALGAMAHYLFGHVAATAAITNDSAFLSYMNGNTDSDAAIAKGLTDKIDNISDLEALEIVKQVLGQDAARAKDQDNNELAPDQKQNLAWMAGDVIYLQVKLKQPTVTVSVGELGQRSAPSAASVTEQVYNLKITLAAPAPAGGGGEP